MLNYFLAFFIVSGVLIALSVKWELNKKISISWSLIMGAAACLVVAVLQSLFPHMSLLLRLFCAMAVTGLATLVTMLGWFFRDPERIPPIEKNVIVSPADGIIRYIKNIQRNEFPFAQKNGQKIPLTDFTGLDLLKNGGVQIGITMTFLDVHVTRAPIMGDVAYLRRIPGKYRSLKKLASLLENEKVVGLINGADTSVGIVLIASRLVRRIVMRLKEGQSVVMGQRIGIIKFGSQVDLLIPLCGSLRVRVSPGGRVTAGETIIADI